MKPREDLIRTKHQYMFSLRVLAGVRWAVARAEAATEAINCLYLETFAAGDLRGPDGGEGVGKGFLKDLGGPSHLGKVRLGSPLPMGVMLNTTGT